MFASSFVICISASLIIICDSYRTGPKRDDNESPKDPIVVKVGSPVVLKCPVYSEYELFYEWSKDSEIIEEFSRYRLKPTGELKIKAASLRDSGMYTCRGVDGFGQDEVNMQLIVTDSKLLTAITELPQAPDSLMVDHLEPSTAPTMVVVGRRRHRAPYFDFPTDRTTITKNLGDSVTFKCPAQGHPKPQLFWTLNGKPLADSAQRKQTRHTLTLFHLKGDQSGLYTCVAQNSMGRAQVSFELEVQSRVETDEHPLLIEGNLVNLTKSVGETAIFHCKVMSETVPLIQWLKKTEKNAMPDDPAEAKHTHLIDKDGNYFRSLQANGAIESANGAHQSRLVIEQVKSTDAGHYVCLAASVKGYSIKSAYLTVEGSDYEADNNVDATYDMSELEASPKLDRIERTQLPEVVLWLSASALLFITFIMIFACSHRATPTIVLPNPCKNNSCPNVAIAESVISQALRSTRTSYDPDMFTRWIYEQNALFHSIQDTTTVDSIITSEICPKKGQRLRAYGKAASEVTTYSLPASTMYNSERDASASDVGRTARPNTPATASNRIDSLNSGLASITESGNEIRI